MVTIKTDKEIEIIKEGGKILAKIMKKIVAEVKPGATTGQLEQLACTLIQEYGGRPSFKGYKSTLENIAFPTALCTSVNDEIVHTPALPSRRLNVGDIIGIDAGMEYPYNKDKKGFYTDMAVTVAVGKTSKQAKKLIKVTKKSLDLAIKQVKPGNSISLIGSAVEKYVEANGFSVVRDLVGHGVGYSVHEDPQIPNYVIKGRNFGDIIMKPGMVLAIEPMVNVGSHEIRNMPDGYTIKTIDKSLSAHFEHTVAVTKNGCEIITKI